LTQTVTVADSSWGMGTDKTLSPLGRTERLYFIYCFPLYYDKLGLN